MKIIVIVPAYNEAKYIGRFLDKLITVISKKNIVVVNDGSSDKTQDIVKGYGLICLSHLVNLGKGAAMKTGCDYAFKKLKAEAVIIMDGDDQHTGSDVKNFIKELEKGSEIVLGVRRLDAKMPLLRMVSNKSVSILINLLFGHYITDIPSGFKAMTRSAYRQVLWHSSGYEVETEIAVRLAKGNLAYTEIPITTIYHDKDYGFNLIDAVGILLKLPYWIWR